MAARLDATLVFQALESILAELFSGPAPTGTWVLDHGSRTDLLATLEALTAEQASQKPIPGHPSIAGHANHLRFSLGLLNRWAGGEPNPFAGADWKASWRLQKVGAAELDELRAALRAEAESWRRAVRQPREWEAISVTGALASAAHVAYHLGAIRQLAHLVAEPTNS